MVNQQFFLPMIPDSAPIVINVNQYDYDAENYPGRLIFNLIKGSTIYNMDGASAVFMGKKPDGHAFAYNADVISESVVRVNLRPQMTNVLGRTVCQLVLSNSDGVVGSFSVWLEVQPSALVGADASGTDIPALVYAAEEAADRAEQAAEDAEAWSAHPPYIGLNGDWYIYDVDNDIYVDSEVSAYGATPDITAEASVDGTTGTPGVEVIQSGSAADPHFDFEFSGLKGETPDITATANVDSNTGTPEVSVTKTGTDLEPNFEFSFKNLKGPKGDPGSGSSVEWGEIYGSMANQEDLAEALANISILGAKNLIQFPYVNLDNTRYGITYTTNARGVMHLSGKCTASGGMAIILTEEYAAIPSEWFGREFALSDGVQAVTPNCNISFFNAQNTRLARYYSSNDEPVIFSIPEGSVTYRIVVSISYNAEVDTDIYPMLRFASDTDNTFRPYAETNYELTQSKMSYEDNGILGAKNLIPYPYYQTTQVVNGITITDNGDGTLLLNGTADDTGVVFRYLNNDATVEIPLENVMYKLTFGGAVGSESFHLGDMVFLKSDDTSVTVNNYEDTLIDNRDGKYKGISAFSIYVTNTTVVDNVIIKPMLRLASDPDETYLPYAMTNKELTDKKMSITDLQTVVAASSDFADFQTRIAAL